MNDYDLIKMHDDITTLHAAVVDLTAAVNQIKNTEVVDLWNHVNKNKQDLDVVQAQARFNAEELQRNTGELTSLSNIAHGNSVTMDDLRNDINGVNGELQELTSRFNSLDHRVRFS